MLNIGLILIVQMRTGEEIVEIFDSNFGQMERLKMNSWQNLFKNIDLVLLRKFRNWAYNLIRRAWIKFFTQRCND